MTRLTGPREVTIERTSLVDELPGASKEQVTDLVHRFCQRRINRVDELVSPDAVRASPFLLMWTAAAYGLSSPRALAEHQQLGSLVHGDATAWADLMNKIYNTVFAFKQPPEKKCQEIFSSIDGEREIEGRRILFSFKSGPLTMNRSHANEMINTFPAIHRQTNSPIVLGLEYGDCERGNGEAEKVIRDTSGNDVHLLVGKPFFEYVTGVRDAYGKLGRLIAGAASEFYGGKSFDEHVMDSRGLLTKSLSKKYNIPKNGALTWEHILSGV